MPSENNFRAKAGVPDKDALTDPSRARAACKVKLLARSINVFKYNILGSWKCCQSVLAPSRTIMALVKAANVIDDGGHADPNAGLGPLRPGCGDGARTACPVNYSARRNASTRRRTLLL